MPRKPSPVDIPALGPLNRQTGNLSLQLVLALKEALRKNALVVGDKLPSSRALAQAMAVSRGTVTAAYEQMIAEGFFAAQGGAGTRVTAMPVVDAPQPAAGVPTTLSPRAARFAYVARTMSPLPAGPFAVSLPCDITNPGDIWRRLGNRVRGSALARPAGYGQPAGIAALRKAIAGYVRRSRAVNCHPDQVIITAGTQQGLYLAANLLREPDEPVWVEDPAYPGTTAIFETAGQARQMCRVPVDSQGIDVDAGALLCPDARMAFVTPSHQYPLGHAMSMQRRSRLVQWARAHNAWIVEDDYDSEFRYTGHPFPSLYGMAPDRVIYLGTFSKILFPSLRLGYVIVPEDQIDAWCGARLLIDRQPPDSNQHILAAFIAEGHLDKHIRRLRGVYASIKEKMDGLIKQIIPPELASLQPCDQGLHQLLWLADGISDQDIARQAISSGIAVRPVSPMYSGARSRQGLILGLGGYSEEAMAGALHKLAHLLISRHPGE